MKTYQQFISQKDIDIKNIIIRLLYGWKTALAITIIFCLLLSFYQQKKNLSLIEEQAILTKEQQRKIYDAIEARKEYAILKEYSDNSIFMTINPFFVYRGNITINAHFSVNLINFEDLYQKISVELFKSIEPKYIKELFSVTPVSENVWEISFICGDQETCKEILSCTRNFIENQLQQADFSEDRIQIFMDQQEVISPETLKTQTEYRALLDENNNRMKNRQAELSGSQYQYMLRLEKDPTADYEPVNTSQKLNFKKIILFGCIGGLIFYVIGMVIWIIMRGKIYSKWEVEEITGIPVLLCYIVKHPKLWLTKKIFLLHKYITKKEFIHPEDLFASFQKKGIDTVALVSCGTESNDYDPNLIGSQLELAISDLFKTDNAIIILFANKTSYVQLYKTLQEMELLAKNIIGFVIFE